MRLVVAKQALDQLIEKSRVHLYKPIQIAEILYRDRVLGDIDVGVLETYRKQSKGWRDEVSRRLLGRACTSSCRFQDNLFEANAIPPDKLKILAEENRAKHGVVEAYIYNRLGLKHTQLSRAVDYCYSVGCEGFDLRSFLSLFWDTPGLRRSIDKVYEVVVYSLFSVIVDFLEIKISVTVDEGKLYILDEFADFSSKVLCLSKGNRVHTGPARLYRVGVTNAADRGLDMWANFGPAIQIKHLALDESLAEDVVQSVAADRIIIVCKTADAALIVSLVNQLGWKSRVQSVVTEEDLCLWYERALHGKFGELLGESLLHILKKELSSEFPAANGELHSFILERAYDNFNDIFWG